MSRAWVLALGLLLAVVFACALTFELVEGDDSITLAYHLLGRNPEIQGRFAAYHVASDFLLGLLPMNERILTV
jgi:hypothetical protein